MDLIERYLQAVKWWLPGPGKDDIASELREDLQSQIDEKRAATGREPDEAEVASILKRCGSPIVVAGRYLPQNHLIGPAVYPMYRAVLRALAIVYVLSWALVGTARLLLGRFGGVGETALAALGGFWNFGLVAFAAVTLIFAAIDRAQPGRAPGATWNPRDLPPARDAGRIPRAGSAVEMALSILFLAWWVSPPAGAFPWTLWTGGRGTPGPVWQDFHARLYWPLFLLAAGSVVTSAVNYLRPYWTRTRLAIRVVVDLVAAVLVSIVIAPHAAAVRMEMLAVRSRRLAAGAPGFPAAVTDAVVFVVLAVAALVCVCQAMADLWRMTKLGGSSGPAR